MLTQDAQKVTDPNNNVATYTLEAKLVGIVWSTPVTAFFTGVA
jgi:hypothetical protein